MKKPTLDELAAFIAKHISYDAGQLSEGVKCPHCGKMAREPVYSYWIDHRQILAGEIARFLGLKVYEQIDDILERAYIDENKKANARNIAQDVLVGVFSDEPSGDGGKS